MASCNKTQLCTSAVMNSSCKSLNLPAIWLAQAKTPLLNLQRKCPTVTRPFPPPPWVWGQTTPGWARHGIHNTSLPCVSEQLLGVCMLWMGMCEKHSHLLEFQGFPLLGICGNHFIHYLIMPVWMLLATKAIECIILGHRSDKTSGKATRTAIPFCIVDSTK